MNIKYFKPLLNLLLAMVTFYIVHKLVFYIFEKQIQNAHFQYSLEILYLIFSALSVVIVAILIKVKQKNINNVGMVFLLLTSIKMFIAFAFLFPILSKSIDRISIEKINFFVIFIIFLSTETLITIRILNNNQ